jgi:hypothetical protein
MSYNVITPPGEPFFSCSRYGVQERTAPVCPCDPSIQWVRSLDAEKPTLDDALLKEALSAYAGPREATLAEQVFGSQARQQRIGLKHLANVLYERTLLHNKRLGDIDHQLTDFLDRLSVLKMHFPLGEGRSQQQLEKLVIELERQRYEEQVSFWKDGAEIRQQLFESAAAYSSAQRRKDMLYGVEAGDV